MQILPIPATKGRCHGNHFLAFDGIFDSRGRFSGVKLSDEDIAEIECLRVVALATNFGTKIAINGFV